MANTTRSRWLDYTIFGLSVFLIFCLIFESYIELPNLVAWLGHWHPVVLHFPIVLLLIAIFLGLTGKSIPSIILTIATIAALITAISGFFLGAASGGQGDLLFWHQWLGGGTAILAVLWYWLESSGLGQKVYSKGIQVVLAGLILFTGHYGGMITHGEDFLAIPSINSDAEIPENPLIYGDIVTRILDEKCVKCHNPNKKKGELLMTSITHLLKGGESGPSIIPGNSEESELIQRLHLPLTDEAHMPPEGEKNLTTSEIQILERWIVLGASDTLLLSHLDNSEPLFALIADMRIPDPIEKWTALPKVADSTLVRLSSDYVTITRLASNVDALGVNIYKPPTYSKELMLHLKPIAANIVQMDVSGLPIGKEELGLIASFSNLEWLEVDQTPISDSEVDTLRVLKKLKTLKIYDTGVGDKTLEVLKELENLDQIYLWKTEVSERALEKLKLERPSLLINTGIDQEIQASFEKRDSIPEN